MCGIVAVVGSAEAGPALPTLLEGLQRLEYRGYDSAGVAVHTGAAITTTKTVGRVADLAAVADHSNAGRVGIAHTRWATHGKPTTANAHPHLDGSERIAVVHNGIIENAGVLRRSLLEQGVRMASDTDTEVLAHLIAQAVTAGAATLEHAVRAVLRRVEGTYGLVVLSHDDPEMLVVARSGSPVAVALTEHGALVASDPAAFVRQVGQVSQLADGEVITVTPTGFGPIAADAPDAGDLGIAQSRADVYELGEYPNFMAKEIAEQPHALRDVLRGRLDERHATARLGGITMPVRDLRRVRRVKLLGCGSAYYAAQLGALAIEELARIPADAEPAAEFRYRDPVVEQDTLYVAVSQSGETIDTFMAVQELQRKGAPVVGVVNVVGSAIARETGQGVFIHAGPELSVASTKAVTNMSTAFVLLGLLLGRMRDLSTSAGGRIVRGLQALPDLVDEVLRSDGHIADIAGVYAKAESMYFIGRYRCFPVAREGAQKLKEISYIHAEAYQASELKHGPLALVDESMPSVVIVPDDELRAKNIATIEQIRARGGPVIAVTSVELPDGLVDAEIRVPRTEPELEGILFNIALQMLSLHIATALGRDVDKPRNLAKSVTVE